MASDVRLSCPNDELANNMQNSFKSPIYRYVSTFRPQVPTALFDVPFKARYAAHGWDLHGFFGAIKKFILQPKLMMILKQQFEEKLFILQNLVHHIQRIGNHFL